MQRGISLIELLIVLAVTGILAAIAYPGYNEQLRRAARSEVVGLLHDAALRLESHRARHGRYDDSGQVLAPLPSGNRHYRLHIRRDTATFVLRAERLPSGLMADDRCGDFQLDQAGARSNSGSQAAEAGCWGG